MELNADIRDIRRLHDKLSRILCDIDTAFDRGNGWAAHLFGEVEEFCGLENDDLCSALNEAHELTSYLLG